MLSRTVLHLGVSRGKEVCATINVEEDINCQCECAIQPSDCQSEIHLYSSSKCQCLCQDAFAKTQCLVSGKKWDEQSCTCTCPSLQSWTCSTGYSYDHERCSCIRSSVFGETCNSFLSFVVAIFVCFAMAVTMVIFYVKKYHFQCEKCQQRTDSTFSLTEK